VSTRRFDRFIATLAAVALSDRARNQYSRTTGDTHENAIRRRNLRLYLEQLDAIGPRSVLVGEAVSHRGGNLTGIAFCSETIMLDGVTHGANVVLGEFHGYRKATPGPIRSTEASATMVWQTIRHIQPLPLLWNAFPFHPFNSGKPLSNRVPTASELLIGQPFIEMLIQFFPIEKVLAVGNQASTSLTRMGVSHEKLRHPSMGGKKKFVEGMLALSSTPLYATSPPSTDSP
jgi:uracil-DNA glycosylase